MADAPKFFQLNAQEFNGVVVAAGPGAPAPVPPGGGHGGKITLPPLAGVAKKDQDDAERLINASPTLKGQIEDFLKKPNADIVVDPKSGTHYDPDSNHVSINPDDAKDPLTLVRLLAHEFGHEGDPTDRPAPNASRSAYVDGHLKSEGAATMNNIKVQREIRKNAGGNDIGVVTSKGNPWHPAEGNLPQYNQIYDNPALTPAQKNAAIGEIYRNNEVTGEGNDIQTYGQWYNGLWTLTNPGAH